jgi:pyrroloquinoline quinone biosynthesis protein E
VLLYPEGVLRLNPTGAAILGLCDGRRDVAALVAALAAAYSRDDKLTGDVAAFLAAMAERGLVDLSRTEPGRCPDPRPPTTAQATSPATAAHRPLGLVAELTFRCPLRCPYCSNPTHFPSPNRELSADEWARVFREAGDLGVLHAVLTGGEPLLRADLPQLVASARAAELYTDLITSGVGLSPARAAALKAAGLDSVQISVQADDDDLADAIAGASAHAAKLRAARVVRALGLPLTLNVVLHRLNIDRVGRIIALAEALGARRLELASTQYYGWAFVNRAALLPTAAQVRAAGEAAAEAADRLRGRVEIVYVVPDYFADRPKPCLHGWGRRYLTVNPVGDVLPCPTAGSIPGLRFDNVRDHPLAVVWHDSDAFNRFRGTAWMPEPCRSCDLREVDFGGCRCQAALLTGDPANTDPACALSPYRSTLSSPPKPTPVPLTYRRFVPAGADPDGVVPWP